METWPCGLGRALTSSAPLRTVWPSAVPRQTWVTNFADRPETEEPGHCVPQAGFQPILSDCSADPQEYRRGRTIPYQGQWKMADAGAFRASCRHVTPAQCSLITLPARSSINECRVFVSCVLTSWFRESRWIIGFSGGRLGVVGLGQWESWSVREFGILVGLGRFEVWKWGSQVVEEQMVEDSWNKIS